MKNSIALGHFIAFSIVVVWGATFVSTKVLLTDFTPLEILFFRFVISFVMLFLLYPKRFPFTCKKEEIYFLLAGLCGITLYYLLENIALTYTLASNVGVIVCVSPFFTAIFANIFLKEKSLSFRFVFGFIVAICGIYLICFGKNDESHFSLTGDLLAFLAAIIWAIYSLLVLKIATFGYNTFLVTRRIFMYGIILMIPCLFVFDFSFNLTRFSNPVYLFNILFLGLGAGALCFVGWNYVTKILGAVRLSVYIYLVPVATVLFSFFILKERLETMQILGIILTIFGLIVSNKIKTK
ncbi:MAG: DMT family transporter [Campylobacteraceae bacterium]